MANIIQLKDSTGAQFYPQTHEKAVIDSNGVNLQTKLANITTPSYVTAWDGASTPVVANIPAGVVVTYNGTSYTGTLAASASTLNKTYLVATGTANNYYRYVTELSGSAYSWHNIGSTEIDLSDYATKEELSQLSQEVGGAEDTVIAASYRQSSCALRDTGAVESTSFAEMVVDTFAVVGGTTFKISGRVGTGAGSCLVAFYDDNEAYISDSAQYYAIGEVSTPYLNAQVSAPINAAWMKVAGHTALSYAPQAILIPQGQSLKEKIDEIRADIDEMNIPRPIPFELGSIAGATSGNLRYLESTTRVRVDLPISDISDLRIIKDGWRIVAYAIYSGTLPTADRYSGQYSSTENQAVSISKDLTEVSGFNPERVIFVLANATNSDLSDLTTVDDIIAIDKIDRSLYGRTVVVMGDSSCDIVSYAIWARILSWNASRMGITGEFKGTHATGWSTNITTPNVFAQWSDVLANLESDTPIVIITTGGNEIAQLQLSYDETIALCGQTITNPSNATEWAVYTLRKILADRPKAHLYIVSNFYAGSTTLKDEQRRVYRGMLRALCDYFSITLIDLTRNSQIRGYLEADSNSLGYHVYTIDGVHAATDKGRYLLYHKIMHAVIENGTP